MWKVHRLRTAAGRTLFRCRPTPQLTNLLIPTLSFPTLAMSASTSSSAKAPALVYVVAERGPDVEEERFQKWYNTEHAPLRLTIPSFLNAARYKSIFRSPSSTTNESTWLTLYDLTDPSHANGPEYKAIQAGASDNEKDILPKLAFLNRRAYSPLSTSISQGTTSEAFPAAGKYVLSVEIEIKAEAEEEFNRWYEEEHLPLLSKIPGWLRGRRYTLFSTMTRVSGKVLTEDEGSVSKYLALHDFSEGHAGFMDTPEWKTATSTEWRDRVMKSAIGRELKVWELSVVYQRPE